MDYDAEAKAQDGRELRDEFGLWTTKVQFNSPDDLENRERWNEDAAAHYDTSLHEVVVDSPLAGARTAAHEHEHAKQAEKLSGVDVDSSYWNVLEEGGLVIYDEERADRIDHDGFGAGYAEGNLMNYLPRLGYDMGLLASRISDDTQLKNDLSEDEDQIENQIEDSVRNKEAVREIAKLAEENCVDGYGDPEDHQPEYSDAALKTLKDTHNNLQEQKENNQILRWNEPRIHAEIEGFAHFLSDVVNPENPGIYDEGDSAERAKFLREESKLYQRPLPGTDHTVGDAAADRVDELFEVKRNLEQHGGMNEKEAVQYILNEVQERKIDYAASQLPEYEDISDIEERLENSIDWP